MTIEQRVAVLRSIRPMRACVIVLVALASCDADKDRPVSERESAPVVAPTTTPAPGPTPPVTPPKEEENEETKPPKMGKYRWDPPTDVPHVASTTPGGARSTNWLRR